VCEADADELVTVLVPSPKLHEYDVIGLDEVEADPSNNADTPGEGVSGNTVKLAL